MTESSKIALPTNLGSQKKAIKHRTLWRDAWRRFFRNRLAIIGFSIVMLLLFLAIFADFLAPFPYDKVFLEKVRLPPFQHSDHLLGTDQVGGDYFSRLIYGARTSMTVGIVVQGIAVLIGIPLGGLAGYLGGKVDFVISRLVDIMTAFPGLLFAILVVSVLGGGLWIVILALSITSWIGVARLMRGQVLSLREKEFIEAAKALGVPQGRIIFRHLLPNALTPILIAVSFGIPAAMLGEAGLSFLGLGVNYPIASWGKMVGESVIYVRSTPYLAIFPTLTLALSMLGFSFVGDGLRDALDPKLIE